jgi:hypothetical protein
MADFGPSPFKAALMAGLGDGNELSQGSPIKKSSVALKQKHFGQPIMKIESIRGTPVNRIGEFHPDEDYYDDGVGADLSELMLKAVDNKASNVLVRTRGNRLTKKQADVKASRIASRAK